MRIDRLEASLPRDPHYAKKQIEGRKSMKKSPGVKSFEAKTTFLVGYLEQQARNRESTLHKEYIHCRLAKRGDLEERETLRLSARVCERMTEYS
jgi:hypothetical protein